MSHTRHLQPRWTDKHKGYMSKALEATVSVAEGAVRAGKTVDNVAVFARMLDKGVPDRIHLATGSTSANAKLNIGDCNGFGLEYIFRGRCSWTKYKGNEALRIKTAGREYIVIFAGGGKSDSFKKIRGNSYGMWIATEINLHHEDMIKEAFNRQLAARTRRVFWDLNPSSPANFIYKNYIDRFADAYGERYCYEHFTIRDNATISEERLREIEAQYDKSSIWYRRDILGERCNVEGLVYDNFSEASVLAEDRPVSPEYYVSSDFGIQNATVFLLWAYSAELGAYICIDEYYYSGRDERRQKTVEELVDGFEELTAGREPKLTIVDPSAAALIVELRRRGHRTKAANNDVLDGISDVRTMISDRRLLFSKRCTHTIEEFGIYSWDAKAADQGEDRPIKESDHAMDAVRYFVKTMHLVKKRNNKEKQEDDLLFL